MTAPVLPEPTEETIEDHMHDAHGWLMPLGLTALERIHDRAHGEGNFFGHTHERSHDG